MTQDLHGHVRKDGGFFRESCLSDAPHAHPSNLKHCLLHAADRPEDQSRSAQPQPAASRLGHSGRGTCHFPTVTILENISSFDIVRERGDGDFLITPLTGIMSIGHQTKRGGLGP